MELISTESLVEQVYHNFDNHKNKKLAVILKRNASSDELSYLKSIESKANINNISILKFYADTEEEIKHIISTNIDNFSGIILLSKYSLKSLSIPSYLDIDCQSHENLSKLFFNDKCYIGPCTANAIHYIVVKNFGRDLSGKNVAIINRSLVVGRPTAALLMKNNATVTIFHSKSKIESLDDYDIVITATGKQNTINRDLFSDSSKNHFIVDVGVTYNKEEKKLCGDVNLESFKDCSNFKIVTSPGGVGPLSTAILLSRC